MTSLLLNTHPTGQKVLTEGSQFKRKRVGLSRSPHSQIFEVIRKSEDQKQCQKPIRTTAVRLSVYVSLPSDLGLVTSHSQLGIRHFLNTVTTENIHVCQGEVSQFGQPHMMLQCLGASG